ncbi:hypothetical protein B0H13DRAFT_2433709, partial [Mycena leptocephala]
MFWKGGVFKVVQDTSQLMGLLVKALINFAKARAAAKAVGVEPAHIGHGIGMVFGLLIVIVLAASVLNHVSTDVSRVDACAQWFHGRGRRDTDSPIAGFALFLLIIPLQERIMAHQFFSPAGKHEVDGREGGEVLEVG